MSLQALERTSEEETTPATALSAPKAAGPEDLIGVVNINTLLSRVKDLDKFMDKYTDYRARLVMAYSLLNDALRALSDDVLSKAEGAVRGLIRGAVEELREVKPELTTLLSEDIPRRNLVLIIRGILGELSRIVRMIGLEPELAISEGALLRGLEATEEGRALLSGGRFSDALLASIKTITPTMRGALSLAIESLNRRQPSIHTHYWRRVLGELYGGG